MKFGLQIAGALLAVAGTTFVVTSFTRPPVISIQRGYRGLGQEVNYLPGKVAASRAANKVPAPEAKQDPAGQPSAKVYQNVKVLGGVDANEFLRVMAAVTTWVAPKQGCTYCHSQANLADDTEYTKIVARRMLQMTEHINKDWKAHVGATGVTCYTCHRGMPVPANIWFNAAPPAPHEIGGMAEVNQGKNLVSKVAAYSSLPYDPLTPYLEGAEDIRVATHTALPGGNDVSIKHADQTYALMMHIADSLGVNCTYCHNSRAFWDWNQSFPAKVTAWYGIRMVRDLNTQYLDKLKPVFPAKRLGALGDAPKINCATCHQGVYKPLYGASMVTDYPEIGADGQVDLTADIGKVGDYTAK
jgi:photosynthetic reaction center cytochrome c subunit